MSEHFRRCPKCGRADTETEFRTYKFYPTHRSRGRAYGRSLPSGFRCPSCGRSGDGYEFRYARNPALPPPAPPKPKRSRAPKPPPAPRPCAVCDHSDRAAIDASLRGVGRSDAGLLSLSRELSSRYGLRPFEYVVHRSHVSVVETASGGT